MQQKGSQFWRGQKEVTAGSRTRTIVLSRQHRFWQKKKRWRPPHAALFSAKSRLDGSRFWHYGGLKSTLYPQSGPVWCFEEGERENGDRQRRRVWVKTNEKVVPLALWKLWYFLRCIFLFALVLFFFFSDFRVGILTSWLPFFIGCDFVFLFQVLQHYRAKPR